MDALPLSSSAASQVVCQVSMVLSRVVGVIRAD
jgi:hypothetical protein